VWVKGAHSGKSSSASRDAAEAASSVCARSPFRPRDVRRHKGPRQPTSAPGCGHHHGRVALAGRHALQLNIACRGCTRPPGCCGSERFGVRVQQGEGPERAARSEPESASAGIRLTAPRPARVRRSMSLEAICCCSDDVDRLTTVMARVCSGVKVHARSRPTAEVRREGSRTVRPRPLFANAARRWRSRNASRLSVRHRSGCGE